MRSGWQNWPPRRLIGKLRQLAAASAALSCLVLSSPAQSGDFTINWGTAPFTWTANSVGPVTYTATDQYGFQTQVRFGITRIGGIAVAGYPDDLTGFGTNTSIWVVWDSNAGSGIIGAATNTATMEILSGGSPFAVNGLNFQISDIDSTDNNAASGDRCDHLTVTGNNGNPALTYVSGVVASRSVRIGPGAGSGSSPALAANQAQCIFNVGAPVSPTSNADDFGSILATYPASTHTATIAYDESIGNVYGIPGYSTSARGIGAWGAAYFSVANTISLAKASTTTLVTAVGQVIPYTYTITNNGPLPINTGQNIYIQDSKIGTFSCGVIGTAIPSGGTYVCNRNYTTVAADLTTGANLANTAIAGVGTGTQAFASRLQSNSANYSIPRAPGLQITKVSFGGTGGFTFNGDNGWGSQVVTTAVSGTPVSGAVKYFTTSGLAASVTETIPATYALTSVTCSGLGAGGNYTVNTASGRVDFDAAAMAAGSNIACTFNNSLIDAVNDNFSPVPINGAGGGTTATVFTNDTIGGASFAAASVTPTLTANGGLTGAVLNANGTITVPPGTTSGTYVLTYRICSVITPASCDTATATIVVSATPPTGGTSCTGTNLANNGGVELPAYPAPAGSNMASPSGVPGWSTNDTAIEIWESGFNGVPAHTGNQFMEMNAFIGTSVLVQTPSAIHNRAQIDTFWAHRGRQGNDTARMTIADNGGGSTVSPNFTTGNTAWSNQSLIHVATATATTLTLTFDSISSTGGASLGNFIDTVEVCQTYLTIAKSEAARTDVDGSTTDTAGDTVTYQYAVANPAGNNRSLASVSVTDDKLGVINVTAPLSGDANTNGFLDPGEIWIVQADYTATLADIEGGSVTNIAYASGSTGSNTIRSDDDTVTATFAAAPELTITKQADATALLGNVTAGQTITYTYVVTNSGNVTIHSVDVSDLHNGSDPDPVPLGETLTDVAPLLDSTDSVANDGVWSDLKPGDSVTFTATYQVTQTDVDMLQ